FEHGAAPSLLNDAHDERGVRHGYDSFFDDGRFRDFLRTSTPRVMTDSTGASAISATRPSPWTSGSRSIAAATPNASASRNEFANGPVATPPASIAIDTNPLSLSHMIARTSAYPGPSSHKSGIPYAILSRP